MTLHNNFKRSVHFSTTIFTALLITQLAITITLNQPYVIMQGPRSVI